MITTLLQLIIEQKTWNQAKMLNLAKLIYILFCKVKEMDVAINKLAIRSWMQVYYTTSWRAMSIKNIDYYLFHYKNLWFIIFIPWTIQKYPPMKMHLRIRFKSCIFMKNKLLPILLMQNILLQKVISHSKFICRLLITISAKNVTTYYEVKTWLYNHSCLWVNYFQQFFYHYFA